MPGRVTARSVAVAACLLLAAPLCAQQIPRWVSKLSVHGYISQAYAVSDDYQIFGIPTEGTTDYRDLALQLRYDQDKANIFVVQLRQERLGESAAARGDVELDWAFYQRNVSDRLSLKAGRIPLPLGIFNEAGGAVTSSPFFRPPYEFYERQYTSKTLEGFLGSMRLGAPAGWSFDVDAYGGQWALDRFGNGERADAREAFGAQLWANTPIEGVRFGGGAYRCTVEVDNNVPADYLMVHGSVEADLDKWRFATEYLSGNLDYYGRYHAYYGQAGYQLTKRLSVHARASVARLRVPHYSESVNSKLSEDLGISLNYAPHPSFMFKLEGHTNEGLLREDAPLDLYGPTSNTRYVIASIVAGF